MGGNARVYCKNMSVFQVCTYGNNHLSRHSSQKHTMKSNPFIEICSD